MTFHCTMVEPKMFGVSEAKEKESQVGGIENWSALKRQLLDIKPFLSLQILYVIVCIIIRTKDDPSY